MHYEGSFIKNSLDFFCYKKITFVHNGGREKYTQLLSSVAVMKALWSSSEGQRSLL